MGDPSISWKHRLEYLGLRFFQVSLGLLPLPWAYAVGEAWIWLIQEVVGWRKHETTLRLQQVFPTKNAQDIQRLRKAAGRNLADNLVEIARAEKIDADGMDHQIDDHDAVNIIQRAREHGKGLLIVIAHSGNWDLAGTLAVRKGIPMCFIARKQKNPLTYQTLMEAREHGGGTVLDRDDPQLLPKVVRRLKENDAVVILVDIRARGDGSPFQFLGHPCRLSNGLGIMASRSGAPVLTISIGRDAKRRHLWKPHPLKWLDPGGKKPAREKLLQDCLDELSHSILSNPESYFWYNKRWVLAS